jgi:pimeloyl-ACP methyl ester carboxylesterase
MSSVDGERELRLHGHRVRCLVRGEGPALVLLHGITSSAGAWAPVLDALAAEHTVIAPDLLGHGDSAKPQGDYSLGAYASGVRDVLVALGVDRASVVGHSLGGGIALQLAYQFPERVERLVLVASGGLGREVHPLLRAATLPGADLVLPLVCRAGLLDAGAATGRALERAGLRLSPDLRGMAAGFASLADDGALRAFLHTARSIMDAGGQRVDASDRLYLAAEMPTLIVWGERDPLIPVAHARAAHAAMPHSRLEVLPGAGHFPFQDEPARFAAVVGDFLRTTEPSHVDEARVRALMDAHAAQAA